MQGSGHSEYIERRAGGKIALLSHKSSKYVVEIGGQQGLFTLKMRRMRILMISSI
jgi:hypothetical protein